MLTHLDLLSAIRKTFKFEMFTARQLGVLFTMAGYETPRCFSAVARELGFSKHAMSRACERLILDGFLVWHRTEHDRRKCNISLTPNGRKFVDEMVSA